MMLRRTPQLLKKIDNVSEHSEHSFEGGANSEVDKDTDGSNLNSKVKFSVKLISCFCSGFLLGSILVLYDLVLVVLVLVTVLIMAI